MNKKSTVRGKKKNELKKRGEHVWLRCCGQAFEHMHIS